MRWRLAMVGVMGAALGAGMAARQPSGPAAGQATNGAPAAETAKPLPLVEETITPVRVVQRDDGVIFADFGRAAFGRLEFDVPNTVPPGGPMITARLGEMLAGADHLNANPGGSLRFLEATVSLDRAKGHCRMELPRNDARNMPADIGAVMPFRYVELANVPAGMTADWLGRGKHLVQIAVHYPFEDKAAEFACSDDKLNAIWDLSKYSMKATSFCGVFVDGDRERKPYEADAYINQLGWYYSTTDTTLPRYTHEYLITHPTWPTEWIMFSVMTGWADYQYTGEATSLKAYYSDLKAKTLRGLERDDGLITVTNVPAAAKTAIHFSGTLQNIVDWPAAERDQYDMKPVNTVVNAFHCHALVLLAAMADALEKPEEAAEFRKAGEKSLAALNTKLFDTARGIFVDGEGSTHSSLHANMFPLAFGLVPAERREKVAAFVASRGMVCSVYGAQFLMESLFDNGYADKAIELMKAPGDRSWRHMVEDVGTTITSEAWDNQYKPNQDWNHAWGAAPANILPRKVLGVEPLEPGYRKVRIQPRTGGLTWARGKVPTVKGTVAVDWKASAIEMRVVVEVPEGSSAQVHMPVTWGTAVEVDGNVVTGGMAVEVAAGRHEFVARR